MIRPFISVCALALSLHAGIPANINFSSDPGSKLNFLGTGGGGTFGVTGASSITAINAPYAALSASNATISGLATVSGVTVLDPFTQQATVGGTQTFTLTAAAGSFLTASLTWFTMQSIDFGGFGGTDLLNTSGVFNLTGFSTSLNGANPGQDAALTALANSAPGQLTLSTTTFLPLTTLFASSAVNNIGAFTMELVTSTPEPGFFVIVLTLGLCLFAAKRHLAPVFSK